jgi:hypothetical protein
MEEAVGEAEEAVAFEASLRCQKGHVVSMPDAMALSDPGLLCFVEE